MLPMPNAYAETQAARHMITTAAAIALYKMHCRGKIPASAVETVNTTIRKYGESRVVASMVEMGLQREKLGDAAFCVRVEKSLPKRPCSFCGTMAFYQERIIPWLIHLSMRQRILAPYRDRVVSSARGRVLEVRYRARSQSALLCQRSDGDHRPRAVAKALRNGKQGGAKNSNPRYGSLKARRRPFPLRITM
jgi:hypothetical protein